MAVSQKLVAVFKCNQIHCIKTILKKKQIFDVGRSSRNVSVASNQVLSGPMAEKLTIWMKFYEDFVGLSDVKAAQNRVLLAEQKFLTNQELRRERQLQLQQIQMKFKDIHTELDKTLRGDDRYLQLVTQEHSIIKEERKLREEFEFYEKSERDYFTALSNAVRESHERERSYAEKTKYWSIIGSVCGAIIGILGTSINNWVRLRELKDLVKESASNASVPKLADLMSELSNNMQRQLQTLNTTASIDGKDLNETTASESLISETLSSVKRLNEKLNHDIVEIKSLLAAQHLAAENLNIDSEESHHGAVIYLGRDIEKLMKDAQHNLEWKIKISSLATVTMIYAGIAISVPLLYKLFGGQT